MGQFHQTMYFFIISAPLLISFLSQTPLSEAAPHDVGYEHEHTDGFGEYDDGEFEFKPSDDEIHDRDFQEFAQPVNLDSFKSRGGEGFGDLQDGVFGEDEGSFF